MYPRTLRLEALESRHAPAVTIVNPTTARFTDVDGDTATIKVSAGTLIAGLFTTQPTGAGEQLQRVNFSAGGFDRVNLTVTAVKSPTGDGLVNVGAIDSTGHDLGAVRVAGDLGQIDAGDSDPRAPAVRALTVESLGRLGTTTQAAGGSLQSDLVGALGSLVVRGDVVGAFVNVNDGADGKVGAVTIGGSLVGGATQSSGAVFSSGDMGAVRIGGDLVGGTADFSGLVNSNGKLASARVGGSVLGGSHFGTGVIASTRNLGPVRIGGDVEGGTGDLSGVILSGQQGGSLKSVTVGGSLLGGSGIQSGGIYSSFGPVGPVTIGLDVRGGTGPDSGQIFGGSLAAVTVGGSVVGGSNTRTGAIISNGPVGAVRIGVDLVGGSIDGPAPSLDQSGYIEAGRLARIFVGGSIISGTDTSSGGALTKNASVRAHHNIGAVTVRGSLVGNTGPDGDSPVIISARGQDVRRATTDLTIGPVTIGGRVEFTQILAGYDVDLVPRNVDAQVGAVVVGGDWIASSLAAGVIDGGDGFGNDNDQKMIVDPTNDRPRIVSKIARVTIKGQASGTAAGADHYGIVAQHVGALKVGVQTFALTPGPANDLGGLAVGGTGDLRVREVGL